MRNFTTILNMDLAVGGQITLKNDGNSDNVPVKEGALFQSDLLAGYKFEPVRNLYITPAVGVGFALSNLSDGKGNNSTGFGGVTASLPLCVDFKYFFAVNDLIGIDVSIINSLDFGSVGAGVGLDSGIGWHGNFRNIFTLKVGPVIKAR